MALTQPRAYCSIYDDDTIQDMREVDETLVAGQGAAWLPLLPTPR